MTDDRQLEGPLIATVGAVVLALSVFQPWYTVSITAEGVALAKQNLANAAQQFGNSAFQSLATNLGSGFNSLAGREVGKLTAREALHDLNVVLVLLAVLAFGAALGRLVGVLGPSQARGSHIALIGLAAAGCVAFRIASPPAAQQNVLSVSVSWGAWLALGSALAIVAGGLRCGASTRPLHAPALEAALEGLSGWTPDA